MTDIAERKLKLLFFEICNKYSKVLDSDNEDIYVKHYGEFDSGEFEEYFFEFYEKAKKNGLPTYSEKEQFIIDQKYWTKENDEELKYKKNKLSRLKKIYSDLFIKTQIDQSKKDIKDLEQRVTQLEEEKKDLIGIHAESYAQSKTDFFYIISSFYKDKELKNKLLDITDSEIDENAYYKYIIIHNKAIEKFNHENIKKIALSESFQNMIGAAETNCYFLFNRPVYSLSYYQSSIYSYGKFFHSVLSLPESKKIESNIRNNPDKLIEWYNAFVNFKGKTSSTKSTGKNMSFVMGANQSDLNYLAQEEQQDLNEIAKSKGGTLNIKDLAKLTKI